jgi:hypothetical protein
MTSVFEPLYKMFKPETLQKALTQAGRKMGAAAEAQVSEYPPQSHAPLPVQYSRTSVQGIPLQSKFKSQKQQGKVFVMIAAGEIPYRRTGRLGQSITSEVVEASPNDVTVSIGTNAEYAPLVIGDPTTQQIPYHRGNWTPLQVDMERGEDAIVQAGYDAMFSALEDEL